MNYVWHLFFAKTCRYSACYSSPVSLNDLVNQILIPPSVHASQLPRGSSSQNNVGS